MSPYNRPYTFELAAQLLNARDDGQAVANVYATASANGIDRGQLDRAVSTLAQLQIHDFPTWIRQEYIVDGWLHGYLDSSADPSDPKLTVWILSQMADAHYRSIDHP